MRLNKVIEILVVKFTLTFILLANIILAQGLNTKNEKIVDSNDVKITTLPGFPSNDPNFKYTDYYFCPEVPASFPGGVSELNKFIESNIDTNLLKSNKGTVLVNFIIEEDGTMSSITIWKGISEVYNNEAIRIIKKMPRWSPGLEGGKPVRVLVGIPIYFRRFNTKK